MISISSPLFLRNLDRYLHCRDERGFLQKLFSSEETRRRKSGFLSFVLFKEKKTSVRKSEWFGRREKERRRPVVDKTSSSCKNLRILPGGLKRGERVNRIVSIHPSRSSPLRDFNSSSNYISAHLSRSLTLCVWRVTVSFSFPLDFTLNKTLIFRWFLFQLCKNTLFELLFSFRPSSPSLRRSCCYPTL